MSSTIDVCSGCNKEQVWSTYNPPLENFSKPVKEVTDEDISFACRWVSKYPTAASTSTALVQPMRTSKSAATSLKQIEEFHEILRTLPKELIRIILQYTNNPRANINSPSRPLCSCNPPPQITDFGKMHAALQKAFPNDSAVNQLTEVPTSTVLVSRPASNWKLDQHILQLDFPKSTSLSFRVFYYQDTVASICRMSLSLDEGCTEARSSNETGTAASIYFHPQHPKSPVYTTAVVAAVETSSQKIRCVAMYHFVDHAMSLEEAVDFPAYREGILLGLPKKVKFPWQRK